MRALPANCPAQISLGNYEHYAHKKPGRWRRHSVGCGRRLSLPRTQAGKNRTSTTLSVIVPAYNEQYLIEASLQALSVLDESPRLTGITVIVVDDCSTDGTAEATRRFQAQLESSQNFKKFNWVWLRHEKNMGKGAAIRSALAHVDTHLVVIHDADLEYHPRDLLQMVDLFLYEDADAVFGSRFMPGGYKRALFFRHELGNKLLTLLCDLVCDLNLTDMETCYKMVRADLLKSIPLTASTFDVEPELCIKLAKRGARIFEVPISYSGRTYAEGKKIGWKDGVRALWAICRYAASDKIYAADGHGGEILLRLNRAPRFSRWMADVIRPYTGSRVLELGAGIGNLDDAPGAARGLLGHGHQSGISRQSRKAAREPPVSAGGSRGRDGRRHFSHRAIV